jgi:hypothetical protein
MPETTLRNVSFDLTFAVLIIIAASLAYLTLAIPYNAPTSKTMTDIQARANSTLDVMNATSRGIVGRVNENSTGLYIPVFSDIANAFNAAWAIANLGFSIAKFALVDIPSYVYNVMLDFAVFLNIPGWFVLGIFILILLFIGWEFITYMTKVR